MVIKEPKLADLIDKAYLVGGCTHGKTIRLPNPQRKMHYEAPGGKMAKTNGYKDTGRTVRLSTPNGSLEQFRVFVFYDNNSYEQGE